jgi:hypothetical protein
MWSIFHRKSQTCGLSFEFSAERRKYTGSTRTGHWELCCATRLHILLLEVFSKCYQLLSSLEACKLGENLAFEIRLLKVDCIHTSTNVTRFRCPHPSSKVSNCSWTQFDISVQALYQMTPIVDRKIDHFIFSRHLSMLRAQWPFYNHIHILTFPCPY